VSRGPIQGRLEPNKNTSRFSNFLSTFTIIQVRFPNVLLSVLADLTVPCLSVNPFQTVRYMCSVSPSLLIRDDFHRDMPPVGGFEAVRYKRNLPLRGPSGLAILGGVTALCAYGFYRVGKGNIEKRWVLTKEMRMCEPFRSAGRETCQVICRAQRGTWRSMGSGRVTHAAIGDALSCPRSGRVHLGRPEIRKDG